jgi:hypothetical protein
MINAIKTTMAKNNLILKLITVLLLSNVIPGSLCKSK